MYISLDAVTNDQRSETLEVYTYYPIGSLSIAEGRGSQNQISIGSTRLHKERGLGPGLRPKLTSSVRFAISLPYGEVGMLVH